MISFDRGLTRMAACLVAGALASACSYALEWQECSADDPCPSGQSCVSGACKATGGGGTKPVIEVSGTLGDNQTWVADNDYLLKDVVFVPPGRTLTIQAGTVVRGAQGSALVVRRGGTLNARGTKSAPVVFTSAAPEGQRAPGDWGGVTMLGSARVNISDASFEAVLDEGLGAYGGTDDAWSCGTMTFVRIEFAGYAVGDVAEYNGLSLAGCGSNTLVDHLHIHQCADDGVQILGGTVNLKHILMTEVRKDGLDWEYGWRGRAQFIVINQGGDQENAMESVNNDDAPDVEPRSEPTIYNFTLIGNGGEGGNQRAIFMEAGAAGHFANGIVIGQSLEAIDIVGAETAALLPLGKLEITHTAFFDIGAGGNHYLPTAAEETGEEDDDGGFDEDEWFKKIDNGNVFGQDPRLPDPYNLDAPSLVPPAGTLQGVARRPPATMDQSGEYLGAFQPGGEDWTVGWTDFPQD